MLPGGADFTNCRVAVHCHAAGMAQTIANCHVDAEAVSKTVAPPAQYASSRWLLNQPRRWVCLCCARSVCHSCWAQMALAAHNPPKNTFLTFMKPVHTFQRAIRVVLVRLFHRHFAVAG